MKKIFLHFFLMMIVSMSAFCQSDSTKLSGENHLYSSPTATSLMIKNEQAFKDKTGKIIRNSGIGLTMAGGSMMVGGIIIVLTDFPYYKKSNPDEAEPKWSDYKTLGTVVALAGGLVLSSGILMTIKGQKKMNEAKSRISFNVGPGSASFTYRF